MSTPEILTLTGLGDAQISVIPEANAQRDALLKEATTIKAVENAFDAECAADVLRNVKALSKSVESARKEVGKPLLEITREINGTAKSFCGPLDAEADRLSRILGAYQQAEREKAAKERRRLEEEERRIRREAEEAAAKDFATEAETQEAVEKAAEAVAAVRVQRQELKASEPEKTQLRTYWKFEVEDIDAIYKARPELCRIEPNGEAIRAFLKTTSNKHPVPGLRAWEDVKTVV